MCIAGYDTHAGVWTAPKWVKSAEEAPTVLADGANTLFGLGSTPDACYKYDPNARTWSTLIPTQPPHRR